MIRLLFALTFLIDRRNKGRSFHKVHDVGMSHNVPSCLIESKVGVGMMSKIARFCVN
jgi:hypothetical protein